MKLKINYKKSCCKNKLVKCFIAALIIIICPIYAFAYLDPGSGSYIFQILIAGLIGSIYAIKLFWKRIKGSVINILKRSEKFDDK